MSAVKRMLVLDAGLILITFFLLLLILSAGAAHRPDDVILAALTTTLIAIGVGFASGFYAGDLRSSQRFIRRGAAAVAVCAVAGLSMHLLLGNRSDLRLAVALGLPAGVAVLIGVRALVLLWRGERVARRVLVIAPDEVLRPFGGAALLPGHDMIVEEPIIVETDGKVPETASPRIRALAAAGKDQRLIVIAGGVNLTSTVGATLLEATSAGCRIVSFSEFMADAFGRLSLEDPDTLAALLYAQRRRSFWVIWTERLIDIATALLLLFGTLPVMILIVIAIRMEDRGPILFRQQRVGLNGRIFTVLKFRTMRTDAEADGRAKWAQRNDDRVTRIGAILRAHRLDELPQLLNVLRGEMALVGPRPERPELVADLRRQIPLYDFRHCALPGLTGWAQINYSYGASVEEAAEKTRYDLYYIQKRGPLVNILILLQTMRVVIFAEGAR